jgi:hypothetical protein
MPRSIVFDSDSASEEIRTARRQQQDEAFQRAMLAAVHAGKESCPRGKHDSRNSEADAQLSAAGLTLLFTAL